MYTNHYARGPTLTLLGLTVALAGIQGCSSDDLPTAAPAYDPNTYFLSLPDWDQFCPPLEDGELFGEPVQEIDWDANTVCSRTECSITATPEDIVTYNPGSEILYLGSLIQGSSYVGGIGTIAELPIRERAALTVTIDLHTSNSSRTVDDPTAATVGDAIHDLVAEAAATGHQSGSSIYYNQTTSHSVEQSALSMGMSARYMGASVRASLEAQATSEENSVAAYFIQRMFTTSLVLPDQPRDFFSSAFTQKKLNEQVSLGRLGPNNLPVYVSNIVWGRMMVLTMTSTMEASRMKAALQASYAGIGGSVEAEHLEVLQQSTIKLVTVGGDAQAALDFLRSGNLGEFFKEDAPLTTAVPLSYTLRNLVDNSIASVSETTSYDLLECQEMQVVVFTNEAQWRDQVLAANFELHDFPTTAPNVALANEVASNPGRNVELGSPLTWETVNTGFPFDFSLSAKEGHLTFWDNEGFPDGTISVGDVDNWQNDDFEIAVTGTNVYALAWTIGDNGNPNGEDLSVWAATDSGEEYLQQFPEGYDGFVGLISPVPLRRIEYNEDGGGDDIWIAHFRFGTRP